MCRSTPPPRIIAYACEVLVSFPDPTPTRGKGSGVLRAISWASRMQNSHVILIIVMATYCLVCGSRMQQHCGLICAAGALSHEKSHAVNLIGAPEIRTATSSSPRNRSNYTRPSFPCRGAMGSGTETSEVLAPLHTCDIVCTVCFLFTLTFIVYTVR